MQLRLLLWGILTVNFDDFYVVFTGIHNVRPVKIWILPPRFQSRLSQTLLVLIENCHRKKAERRSSVPQYPAELCG